MPKYTWFFRLWGYFGQFQVALLNLEDFMAFCSFEQCRGVYFNHFRCLGHFVRLQGIEIWLLNLDISGVFLSFKIISVYFSRFRVLRLFWTTKWFQGDFLDILWFQVYFDDFGSTMAILVTSRVFFMSKNNFYFDRKNSEKIKKPINIIKTSKTTP